MSFNVYCKLYNAVIVHGYSAVLNVIIHGLNIMLEGCQHHSGHWLLCVK